MANYLIGYDRTLGHFAITVDGQAFGAALSYLGAERALIAAGVIPSPPPPLASGDTERDEDSARHIARSIYDGLCHEGAVSDAALAAAETFATNYVDPATAREIVAALRPA